MLINLFQEIFFYLFSSLKPVFRERRAGREKGRFFCRFFHKYANIVVYYHYHFFPFTYFCFAFAANPFPDIELFYRRHRQWCLFSSLAKYYYCIKKCLHRDERSSKNFPLLFTSSIDRKMNELNANVLNREDEKKSIFFLFVVMVRQSKFYANTRIDHGHGKPFNLLINSLFIDVRSHFSFTIFIFILHSIRFTWSIFTVVDVIDETWKCMKMELIFICFTSFCVLSTIDIERFEEIVIWKKSASI